MSDIGDKAERQTLKRVKGSGAWVGHKGDLESDDFLLENKATEKNSYSLKLEVLRKIGREALRANRRPSLMLQFTNSTGRPRHDGAWVLVRESDWREMTRESCD